MRIFCEELDGSYFTKQLDSLYVEKGLLRKFDVNNEYNEDQMKDAFFLIHSIKLAPQQLSAPVTQFSFTSFDEKSPTF